MADQARRFVAAVGVPVIADADNGYGNALNVVRTVREYAAAGVAALHIEDQVVPEALRPHGGQARHPAPEMVEKVRAAVEAPRAPDVVLIARSDARAAGGPRQRDRARRRYRDAGADLVFIDALESEAETVAFGEALPDTPKVINWVEGGKTPLPDVARLGELEFRHHLLAPLPRCLPRRARSSQRLARCATRGPSPSRRSRSTRSTSSSVSPTPRRSRHGWP